jgi:hypothetical protein
MDAVLEDGRHSGKDDKPGKEGDRSSAKGGTRGLDTVNTDRGKTSGFVTGKL